MDFTEKTICSDLKFQGKIVTVKVDTVLRPDGKEATREVVEHVGGVCIAALTEKNEILLVRQFRYPLHKEMLELPAGKIDLNEDPLCCAIRELKEETGVCAKTISHLCSFYVSPGFCNELIHIYSATGLKFGESQPDDGEFIEVFKVPFEEALEMVLRGEIDDGKTVTGILAIATKKQRGQS